MSPMEHGRFLPNKELFKVGEHLQYECDEGYMSILRNIVQKVQCQAAGWSDAPQCIEITCSVDSAGFHNVRQSYHNGDVEQFSCKGHLELEGSDISQCYYYGWDPPLPTCQVSDKKIRCPPPPQPANTEQTLHKRDYFSGDKVAIKCQPGFKLYGSASVLCKDGHWTSPPQCVRVGNCESPPPVQFGTISPATKQKEFPVGRVVTYRCNEGFHMRGSDKVLCIDGEWVSPPVCLKIGESCSSPPVIRHGELKSFIQEQYPSGSSVEYQCQRYFKPQGSLNITCEHGQWLDPPICLEPCTVVQSNMAAHNIRLRREDDDKLYSEHDNVVEFMCLPGFKPELSDSFKVRCNRGKLNYPKCVVQGSCTLSHQTMGKNFIEPKNGELEVEAGKSIEFQCLKETVPEQGQVLRSACTEGKIQYPKCVRKRLCTLSQETMMNNYIEVKNGEREIEEGKSVEFQCAGETVTEQGHVLKVTCVRGNIVYPKCAKDIPGSCRLSEESINNNNLILGSARKNKMYREEERLLVRCKPRHFHSSLAPLEIVCNNGVMTYPKCFTEKPCRLNQDKLDENFLELDPVHNNDVIYENNSHIKFVCKPGHVSDSDLTGICIKEDILYPTCRESADKF
ncbi:coagulation factor XIII B chain isoform X2 [Bombina bombina]|nr:coagulation factor XIII B chain isoform X2 [Bombina bombina]